MNSTTKRLRYFRYALVLAWLVGFFISFPLWLGDRVYPLVPFVDVLDQSMFITVILVAVFVIGLVLMLRSKSLQIGVLLVSGATLLFWFFDQSRMQPWVYLYFFMALSFVCIRKKEEPEVVTEEKEGVQVEIINKDNDKSEIILRVLQLIVASVYIFSGLQKINPAFLTQVAPWMLQPAVDVFPFLYELVPLLAAFIPIFEILFGVFLLIPHTRKAGVILLVLLHVYILFAIGPLGHNWNSVVWPWNIFMMIALVLVFWNVKHIRARDIVVPQKELFQNVVFVLFLIMPLFNFVGLWDEYLSSSLYSGNTYSAAIHVDGAMYTSVPQHYREYFQRSGIDSYVLQLSNMSYQTMNVPPYPEKRIFLSVFDSFCGNRSELRNAVLEISKRFEQPTYTHCSSLRLR